MASSYYANLAYNRATYDDSNHSRLSYGCLSFERVLFEFDYDEIYTHATSESYVSIFAGGESICNRIPAKYLAAINQYKAGTGFLDDGAAQGKDTLNFAVDTGTWALTRGDELRVNIDTPAAAAANDVAVTVNAEVNGILSPNPKRFLYRTDNAFMLEGVSELYVVPSGADDLMETADTIELTYGSETISQPVHALCHAINVDSVGDAQISNLGLCYEGLPRDIQVNTSASDLYFIGIADVPVTGEMVGKQTQHATSKLNQITAKEKKYYQNK